MKRNGIRPRIDLLSSCHLCLLQHLEGGAALHHLLSLFEKGCHVRGCKVIAERLKALPRLNQRDKIRIQNLRRQTRGDIHRLDIPDASPLFSPLVCNGSQKLKEIIKPAWFYLY